MNNKFNRREFIRRSSRIGLAAGLSSLLPTPLQHLFAQNKKEKGIDLAVVKGPPDQAAERAISTLGGIDSFVKEGDRVLLKPNLSFANPPEWGTTTDPNLIRAVAGLCIGAGARKVVIMDHTLRAREACLQKTGIKEALKGLKGVALLLVEQQRFFTEVEVPEGKELSKVEVAKEVTKSDVIINLPCAKSHSATGVSFGIKNLMGLIWDRSYLHRSTDLNQSIAELSTVIKPRLTILDATRALVTGGPGGPGKVKELGTVVAGSDPVAVDSYATTLAPWYGRTLTGKQVHHIVNAHKMGLGEIDIDGLNVEKITL
jgi:uncharacterized protein (DUF362 family)